MWRVLARLDRRIGGARAGSAGFVYALDVAGQHLAQRHQAGGRRRRPWTPSVAFVDHLLAVTELWVRLVEADRQGPLELIEFQAEPGCWRRFLGPGGADVILKPDAFARVGLGHYEDAWFVEVDRATESPSSLGRQLSAYRQYWSSGREQARHGVFPQVLVLVPTERRQEVVETACRRQPAEAWPLFRVAPYEHAVAVMAEGGQP